MRQAWTQAQEMQVQWKPWSQLQHGQEPNPWSLHRIREEQADQEDKSVKSYHGHCPLRQMRQAEPQAGRLQVQQDPSRLQQDWSVDRMLQL
jgi:hypothetical protein